MVRSIEYTIRILTDEEIVPEGAVTLRLEGFLREPVQPFAVAGQGKDW